MGNMETAVHIIQPDGLEPKAAICNFENGFGTTVGYDDAECDVANYYLGNKYIRAITENDSSLKVKHHYGSVEQWNKVTLTRNNKLNLKNGGHVCGDDSIGAGEVTLGNGGINGDWTGQSQVMIGIDLDPEMDPDCMLDYDTFGNSSDYK